MARVGAFEWWSSVGSWARGAVGYIVRIVEGGTHRSDVWEVLVSYGVRGRAQPKEIERTDCGFSSVVGVNAVDEENLIRVVFKGSTQED